ncbi:MAG: hypothetical protein LBP20_01755 [Treponema sp.]|nr:hypothetical protein [Treponema sp.]
MKTIIKVLIISSLALMILSCKMQEESHQAETYSLDLFHDSCVIYSNDFVKADRFLLGDASNKKEVAFRTRFIESDLYQYSPGRVDYGIVNEGGKTYLKSLNTMHEDPQDFISSKGTFKVEVIQDVGFFRLKSSLVEEDIDVSTFPGINTVSLGSDVYAPAGSTFSINSSGEISVAEKQLGVPSCYYDDSRVYIVFNDSSKRISSINDIDGNFDFTDKNLALLMANYNIFSAEINSIKSDTTGTLISFLGSDDLSMFSDDIGDWSNKCWLAVFNYIYYKSHWLQTHLFLKSIL